MEKSGAPHPLRSVIIVIALATAFSSFTLWLIESWIRYPLFIFELLTIITIYLISSGYDFKISKSRIKFERFRVNSILAVLLILSAAILLIINMSSVQEGIMQIVLALFATSFLPGYALLSIFKLKNYFSKLECLILSYILSYAFTAFVTLVLLSVNEIARAQCVLCSYILLGSLMLIKRGNCKQGTIPKSLTKNIDSLGILIALSFFALSFCFLYPSYALLPGTDISQHYGLSILLNRSPGLYIGSTYVFAHVHESIFITLSNSSLVSTQIALLTLCLFLPLAFYIMAKSHLQKIDVRLPIIATLFWALFTNSYGGFSWFYFTYLKTSSTSQTQLQLLGTVADKTYNGTIYGILGLWYVPATISFVVLMAAIFLLSKKEISTSKFIALFSIIMATLYLTHVTEAVVFIMFLAIFGIVSKNATLKIDEALKASIISFVIVVAVFFVFSQVTARFIFDLPLLVSIALPILLLAFSLVARNLRLTHEFRKSLYRANFKSAPKIFAMLLTFAYFVALLSWVSFLDTFHTSQVDTIGVVPWFMYPLMLGITGLLSMLTLYYITEDVSSYIPFKFFIAFMVFAFFTGIIVSTLNLYFLNVNYWEKRFIWFIKIPLAILAPLPILLLIDKLRKRANMNFRTVASCFIIGTIVLYGVSTTFLNLDYWNITVANPMNEPSSAEMNAVYAFAEILDNDPRAWMATITSRSASTAAFAAPADKLVLRELLYAAYTPEMAFTQFYRHPAYSHPYIYLDARDAPYLIKYPDSFLSTYLYYLPEVFKNSEVTIYNVSSLSFPQSISETALIVPFDKSIGEQNLNTAYSMLSQGFYNYSVAYDLDQNALDFNTIVLPFDPLEGNTRPNIFQDNFNQTFASWSVIKGNWRIENAQLLGGESGIMGEGVCLSPTLAENFTATARVTPIGGNTTMANYASIIYSWVDSKNYRVADIYFNADGYIYLLFRDFANGVETDFPTWPGAKTTLKWAFNDNFAVKLTVNGASNEISLNDTAVLSSNMENTRGNIGLRYFRFSKVSFDDFFVNYTTLINSRPIHDYLSYLNAGGRIILLNTGGNGFFAKDIFSISNFETPVQQIEGDTTKIDFPHKFPAPLMSAKDNSTTIISNYLGANAKIPFISQKDYENGELLYLNVYPIIRAIQTSSNQSAFYPLLGELLDGSNLTKMIPTTPLSSINGYVREISLKDNVSLETSSILFPLGLKLGEIVVTLGNSSLTFYDVTGIELSHFSRITIETDNAKLQNGDGLYTDVQLNSTFSIKAPTSSLNLNIKAGNETYTLDNVNSIAIDPDSNVHLQVRTPTITSFEVNFVELYLNNYPQLTTQISGQNLNVTGFTKFSVMISDYYQAIGNLTLGSSLQSDSQATQYNFLSTLPTAIFWALLLLPVFMSIFIIFTLKKPSPKKKRAIEKTKKAPKS